MTRADGFWGEADIRLRAPEPTDLESMFCFENATEVWEMSNTTGPYSRRQLLDYIRESRNDLFEDRQLRLMIEAGGKKRVAGILDLCAFDPLHSRAEVGIVVDRDFRRQGVGRTALRLLEEHCFLRLGIHQLYAYVAERNTPCRRLFAACGYVETVRLKDWMRADGKYVDVLVVQKLNTVS